MARSQLSSNRGHSTTAYHQVKQYLICLILPSVATQKCNPLAYSSARCLATLSDCGAAVEQRKLFILEEILNKPQEVRDLKPIQKSVKALHAQITVVPLKSVGKKRSEGAPQPSSAQAQVLATNQTAFHKSQSQGCRREEIRRHSTNHKPKSVLEGFPQISNLRPSAGT
jgi:hypothetical protein